MVTLLAVLLLGSYLLGSIPFGYLAGRLAGSISEQAGSGNVGATNVVRVLGKQYGYPVFALDVLKGFGARKDLDASSARTTDEWNSPEIFGILAAMSSVLGHFVPAMAYASRRKRRCDVRGALLALTPVATLIGVAGLDNCVLADPLSFIGFHYSCDHPTYRNSRDQLAEPKQRKTISLLFRIRRSDCHLAASFKSFATDPRHRTTLYSKMRVVKRENGNHRCGGWGTALASLWARDGQQVILWGHNADSEFRTMRKTRENRIISPGSSFRISAHYLGT